MLAREHLLSKGFIEQRLDARLRHPTRKVRSALSLDHEVEQIARSILEHRANGREFHEMGILFRVREPYASAFESVFGRFGIPARFHFTDALAAHPRFNI